MRHVCVFCGSAVGLPVYRETAERFGQLLAQSGLGLVYGGGHIGMMGVLADAVLRAGGEVIGVIPRFMVDKELAHTGVTTMYVVDTMHQRKALMADLSDAFAALPGGFGTADELFEILTWAQLGLHAKPIGLLNVEGFFDPLLAWLDQCVSEGFVQLSHRGLLVSSRDAGGLLEVLLRHHPIRLVPKVIEPRDR